jgi:hypothetical protein
MRSNAIPGAPRSNWRSFKLDQNAKEKSPMLCTEIGMSSLITAEYENAYGPISRISERKQNATVLKAGRDEGSSCG